MLGGLALGSRVVVEVVVVVVVVVELVVVVVVTGGCAVGQPSRSDYDLENLVGAALGGRVRDLPPAAPRTRRSSVATRDRETHAALVPGAGGTT